MKLIVGLGNPGKKYEETWHNLGFLIIDRLEEKFSGEFLKCKNSKKHQSHICENNSPEEKMILAKPQTFMNNSGQAVKSLANFYKIESKNIWIIHDDIDLPIGKIRISQNSSAAGHNGVKSIINEIGTQEFIRIRIGIKPDTSLNLPTEKYVLQKINKESKIIINETVEKILAAIEVILAQGVNEAMNEFN